MKTIWKYPIPVHDEISVEMPHGAEVLCVQVQKETVCLWARVDPEQAVVERRFCIRGTGHKHDGSEGRYVNSFQLYGGELVFHLFEHTQPMNLSDLMRRQREPQSNA